MIAQTVFQRYELKYLLTLSQYEALLAEMEPHMTEDVYGHSSIRNLYLDTPDFRLIRRSLEKPVYKEKLRLRSYGKAGMDQDIFVEVKKKYCAEVFKRRLALPQTRALACLRREAPWPQTQIGAELSYAVSFYHDLAPAVFLSYERDAFRAADGSAFRVTFDTAICYRREALTLEAEPWGTALLPQDQVLMELKAGGGVPMWMVRALSRMRLYQTTFSKYGAAYQHICSQSQGGFLRYA